MLAQSVDGVSLAPGDRRSLLTARSTAGDEVLTAPFPAGSQHVQRIDVDGHAPPDFRHRREDCLQARSACPPAASL